MAEGDTEWEICARPWKKIKRTYSSRANGQSFRESRIHDKDRRVKKAKDTMIRLPLDLTADQAVGNDEDLAGKDDQHIIVAQRARLSAPGGTLKNVQVLHGSQILGSPGSTGLNNRRLIVGICKALEALLRATTCKKTNYTGGCRSLFSTCLRQIPMYIAEEQRLTNDKNPENDIDMTSEVYTGLEAFGSAPEGGWEYLREVVRAHGVSLVAEAIREGLIELPLSRQILSLCLGLAAYDEAECVVEGMLALLPSRSRPSKGIKSSCTRVHHSLDKSATSHRLPANLLKDEISRTVSALKHCVSQTGRHGFMYRQIAMMLDDGTLPVDWISSKAMIECWNGVLRSITQQDDHAPSAALLLQTAVSRSYKRWVLNAKASPQVHDLRLRAYESTTLHPTLRSQKSGQAMEIGVEGRPFGSREAGAQSDDIENALQSTFSNILAVLSAINVLRSPKPRREPSQADLLSMALTRDMGLEIRQYVELANVISNANPIHSVPTKSLRLPLLSAGLVLVATRKVGTKISPNEVLDLATLASLPSSNEWLGCAGSFLAEVARCCDEAESGDGFSFIQVMVQNLISIATSNAYDKPIRIFCNGIARAAAFSFSEDTGQPKHLDWALDMEGAITRTVDDDSPKVVVNKTEARTVMRNKSGYKWEEGICEWIAKTPALALQRLNTMKDVNHEDSFREAPKLALVHTLHPQSENPRLPRPKGRHEGRKVASHQGSVKGSYRNSSEKLLFIRVSPHPRKVACPLFLSKAVAVNDLDELSTPESSQEEFVALREIPNLRSDVKRKVSGRKRDNEVVEGSNLDMPPTKRHRLDTEAFAHDTDDELGFL